MKNKSHIKHGRVQPPRKPQPTQPPVPPCQRCEHLKEGKVDVKKGKKVTVYKCERYEERINCPKIEVHA